jgi:hypothetical protein
MIEIPSNLTIPKIIDLYDTLSDEASDKLDLQLPSSLRNNHFGVVFSLLQFIANWVRNPASGKLILPIVSDEDAVEYLKNEFVYPAVVLSWEKDIINRDGDNLRRILKKPSQEYYRELDFFNNKEHLSVPIFCFDH